MGRGEGVGESSRASWRSRLRAWPLLQETEGPARQGCNKGSLSARVLGTGERPWAWKQDGGRIKAEGGETWEGSPLGCAPQEGSRCSELGNGEKGGKGGGGW